MTWSPILRTGRTLLVVAAVAAGGVYIAGSLRRSAPRPESRVPPDVEGAPARLYGIVEPAGREVYVEAPEARRVTAVLAREGDAVKAGQPLVALESDVERRQVEVARARTAALEAASALSRDTLRRNVARRDSDAISEYELTQSRLRAELDMRNVETARREAEAAAAALARLTLRAPIDGLVYKLDVRLGETLASGEPARIVLGARELQVRLFVEAFWLDRVAPGARFRVSDAERGEPIGEGVVERLSPVMGRRDFRTEDVQERFDTKTREVVLRLESVRERVPLGLSVLAEAVK